MHLPRPPVKPTRITRAFVAVLLLAGLAAFGPGSSAAGDATASAAAWAKQICRLVPADELQRTYNSYRPDRSGDIQFFAKPPDFVGSGLPHVGPWDYVETVPMLWYGPGYVKPGVTVRRPVTLADMAHTEAALLNYDFDAPDARPMSEALVPESQRKTPPKLIVTVIWDAAGMVTLGAYKDLGGWPSAWPYLKSLQSQGTWYSDATVGLSPTSTAQSHATIGTGTMPMYHGLIAHHFRIGDEMTTPWSQGSRLLDLPTLSDLYDRASGNKPIIAAIGTVPIHLGMESHGTAWGGGDRDIAIITNVNNPKTLGDESPTWGMTSSLRPYYTTPSWVDPDGDPTTVDYRRAQYDKYVKELDQQDGKLDGKWRGQYSLDTEQTLYGFESPARIPWETDLVKDLIKRAGLGQDETPDLLFVNYKVIDYVSHVQSMNSLYMKDSVQWQDDSLRTLVAYLDKEVGKGNYVLNVTADHGAMPDPKVTGAFVASPGKIGSAVNDEFGEGTVMLTQNTTAFLDLSLLESRDYTVDDVARFVGGLTKGETYLEGSQYSQNEVNDKLFVASFPSYLLPEMPCVKTVPLN